MTQGMADLDVAAARAQRSLRGEPREMIATIVSW